MSRGLETLLFWVIALAGFVALAPCLVLPPWLEYQAQLVRRKEADEYVAALKARAEGKQKQIEHLQHDEAYLLRMAQQEFGMAIRTPNSETVFIGPSPAGSEPPGGVGPTIADDPNVCDVLPELSEFIEKASARYPYTRLFVQDSTRPVMMGIGALLLLTESGLLGRAGLRDGRRAETEE